MPERTRQSGRRLAWRSPRLHRRQPARRGALSFGATAPESRIMSRVYENHSTAGI
jgi:hypothetical protein